MSLDPTPGSTLIVPVVLWGRHPPSHQICSVYVSPDRRTLVTGSANGHIITWNIDPATLQPTPYMLLVGHTARVVCLSDGLLNTSHKYLVSAADNGELCTWDLQEGQCIETNKLAYVHRQIQAYQPKSCVSEPTAAAAESDSSASAIGGAGGGGLSDVLLFCCGEYADVAVIHPLTLQLLRWLASRHVTNWITSLHVFRPSTVNEDVVMGVTLDGMVKIWLIDCVGSDIGGVGGGGANSATTPATASAAGDVTVAGDVSASQDSSCCPVLQHYEDESKRIRCADALHLRCCAHNQRIVLVVGSTVCQVYDASDFSLLCSVPCEPGDGWLQGEFVSVQQLVLWSRAGRAFIYHLPASVTTTSDHYRPLAGQRQQPVLVSILQPANHSQERLYESPCSTLVTMAEEAAAAGGGAASSCVLIRADCTGQLLLWKLPPATPPSSTDQQSPPAAQGPAIMTPSVVTSLSEAWNSGCQPPVGILDGLEEVDYQEGDEEGGGAPSVGPRLTCSLYVPLRAGHLVCGRSDGSVVIVPATQTVQLQLLTAYRHQPRHPRHQQQGRERWHVRKLLCGHQDAVTTLLYPYAAGGGGSGGATTAAGGTAAAGGGGGGGGGRFRPAELVTGGRDFSVCLWDLVTGTLLHRFVVQAGVITQLLVPPDSVTGRLQQCVCSVAGDHSVALLSLKDRRCVMLAARHVFPVLSVRWRPLDDFMMVETEDGSVSVWQMETGHLDRVIEGASAQDVLLACDEQSAVAVADTGAMANPALHLFRGLRHRNMAAVRHAAKRGLQQLQNPQAAINGLGELNKERTSPLLIQGLRTHAEDPDSHVLFFDVESLIGYLSRMKVLKEQGDTIREQLKEKAVVNEDLKKLRNRAQQARVKLEQRINKELDDKPDAAGLFARVKEGAEAVGGIINVKPSKTDAENGAAAAGAAGDDTDSLLSDHWQSCTSGSSHVVAVCQLLLSLVHSWGVDAELDRVCESRLGLLPPRVPVCFGLISKNGFMSLLLPTFVAATEPALARLAPLDQSRLFTRRLHWRLSCALSTNHLLTLIALAHTLMSFNNNNTLMSEFDRQRKLHRQLTRALSSVNAKTVANGETRSGTAQDMSEVQAHFWSQVREAWSRVAALHCAKFSERLESAGVTMRKPLLELLAIKWQDRCVEIRQAAQALLLAELRRLSARALKAVVDAWASLLPPGGDQTQLAAVASAATAATPATAASAAANTTAAAGAASASHHDTESTGDSICDEYGEDQMEEEAARRAAASAAEARRKQATAVILLGVIGAEFGDDVSASASAGTGTVKQQQQQQPLVDGFGLGPLALRTSQALAHLLLAPPSARLPAHTALRRAAIDLIGRGFSQWQPHIDASRVLLAMLELCCEAHPLAPSVKYGLPLSPAADTARTARHAISSITRARPQVFITTMAREVARYNSLQQNAQPLNVVIQHTVLVRARAEILRVLEQLVEGRQCQLHHFLVELCDILLHCLDPSHMRQRPLSEVFPAVARFSQISHCTSSRRLAAGTVSGALAVYDLRHNTKTLLNAHAGAVSACAFSPDGKFLASYSSADNKISFWQTSAGMFGLGQSQTRCVKTYSTPPLSASASSASSASSTGVSSRRQCRLVWIGHRTVSALLADSTEQRYNV